MKKIINYIIKQELESLDDYLTLVKPLINEFDLDYDTAGDIINSVIEWETSSTTIENLENFLLKKFPDVVTN